MTVAVSENDSPITPVHSDWLSSIAVTLTGLTITVQEADNSEPSTVIADIMAAPTERVETTPFSSTAATSGLLEVHLTVLSVVFSGNTVASRAKESPTVPIHFCLFKLREVAITAITFTLHVAETLEPSLAITVMTASPGANPVIVRPYGKAIFGSLDSTVTVLIVALSGLTVP